jgi:hypothetical protein
MSKKNTKEYIALPVVWCEVKPVECNNNCKVCPKGKSK